jgi:hypothetical protein
MGAMRWLLAWLTLALALACTAPPQPLVATAPTITPVSGQFTERADEPWKLTATAEARPPLVPTPLVARVYPTVPPSTAASPRPGIAEAACVDPRRLAADPPAYSGQAVRLQGRALAVGQLEAATWVQLMAEVPQRSDVAGESVVVYVRPKNLDLLRGEQYWVYGQVAGTVGLTLRLTGVREDNPLVNATIVLPVMGARSDLWCEVPRG